MKYEWHDISMYAIVKRLNNRFNIGAEYDGSTENFLEDRIFLDHEYKIEVIPKYMSEDLFNALEDDLDKDNATIERSKFTAYISIDDVSGWHYWSGGEYNPQADLIDCEVLGIHIAICIKDTDLSDEDLDQIKIDIDQLYRDYMSWEMLEDYRY